MHGNRCDPFWSLLCGFCVRNMLFLVGLDQSTGCISMRLVNQNVGVRQTPPPLLSQTRSPYSTPPLTDLSPFGCRCVFRLFCVWNMLFLVGLNQSTGWSECSKRHHHCLARLAAPTALPLSPVSSPFQRRATSPWSSRWRPHSTSGRLDSTATGCPSWKLGVWFRPNDSLKIAVFVGPEIWFSCPWNNLWWVTGFLEEWSDPLFLFEIHNYCLFYSVSKDLV